MKDKYSAAPRLREKLLLAVAGIGTAVAASAWILLAFVLVPFGFIVRAGRALRHGPRSTQALQPE